MLNITEDNYQDYINDDWFYNLYEDEREILYNHCPTLNLPDFYYRIFKLKEIKTFHKKTAYHKNLNFLKYCVNLVTLNCKGSKIHSLVGIENLINLEYIDCSYNYLESLKGIENFIKLKELYCANNKITTLKELKNCYSLEILDISNNDIKSLKHIKYCFKLTEIKILNSPSLKNSIEFLIVEANKRNKSKRINP